MSFTRSPKGLENTRNFKGVDIIVYTEGGDGRQLTKEEIVLGGGQPDTDDAKFWQGVIAGVRPGIKAKVLSVGDCKVVESIAENIVENDLKGLFVAYDRDYKDFFGPDYRDERVVLSYGYSWESDLFDEKTILGCLESIVIRGFDRQEMSKKVHDFSTNVLNGLQYVIRCDQVFVVLGGQLFDRGRPGSILVHDAQSKNPPAVDKERLIKNITKKKKQLNAKGVFLVNRTTKIDPCRHAFGKFLLHVARRIIRCILREINQTAAMADSYLDHFLMEAFHSIISSRDKHHLIDYYNQVVGRAVDRATT